MKKMFSTLAMLLVVAVMTTAVGAADQLDPAQIYTAANKKMESVGTMAMRGTMRMVLETGGETVDTTMGLGITTITRGDDVQMMVSAKSEELGVTTDVYYKDGYYYQKVGDLKIKTRMDVDQVMAQASVVDMDAITEDMMKNATVEQVDGGVKINLVMKSEGVNEMVSGMLDGILGELGEDVSIKYGDIAYNMTVGENGYMDAMQMAFSAEIKTGEETVRVKYAVNLKVTAINSPIAIPYPRDLDSYIEM